MIVTRSRQRGVRVHRQIHRTKPIGGARAYPCAASSGALSSPLGAGRPISLQSRWRSQLAVFMMWRKALAVLRRVERPTRSKFISCCSEDCPFWPCSPVSGEWQRCEGRLSLTSEHDDAHPTTSRGNRARGRGAARDRARCSPRFVPMTFPEASPRRPRGIVVAVAAASYLMVWIVAAIAPIDRFDWFLENLLVFALVAPLLATYRRFPLSEASYLCMLAFLVMHAVGAHYTYSRVPPGFAASELFGFTRNHYDRVAHFMFGLLFA